MVRAMRRTTSVAFAYFHGPKFSPLFPRTGFVRIVLVGGGDSANADEESSSLLYVGSVSMI